MLGFECDSIFWQELQNHSSVTIHIYVMRIKATPFSADMFMKHYNINNRAKGRGLGAGFRANYIHDVMYSVGAQAKSVYVCTCMVK